MKKSCYVLLALVTPVTLAFAQSIDRVKLTDGDMSCSQIYREIGEMEDIMGVAQAERTNSSTTSATAGMAQQATGVAVHAAAMSGSLGAAVGLAQAAPILGLFGSVTKASADSKEKASTERMADAKARKEHLTGMFVSRNCKLSEVQAEAAKSAN